MDTIIFLLLIIILVAVVSLRNSFRSRMNAVDNQLVDLADQLERFLKAPTAPVKPAEPKQENAPATTPSFPAVPIPATPPSKPVETPEHWQSGFQKIDEPVAANQVASSQATFQPRRAVTELPQPKPAKPSFFERNPDLEKFIGENLVSKIGIVILVIAIGFFVKYAIDQQWIGPAGRVGIGVLCGAILVALAHRMRNAFRAFSSVLTGGGLAVLYFTITLAFQQFHLFGQTAAFIIMVIITGFSVALSLLYNKQEVAVLALVGGFATPFMASNGGGNYQALFTYLLILDAGLLAVSYFKKWRLLNLLAFVFTIILFSSWLATLETNVAPNTYLHGLWFATAFYLVFFAINVAHNIRQNKAFIASDFGILLANTALYFSAAVYCLHKADLDVYRGLLCILLAVFNLGVSYTFFRNKKVDTNILYLLIGITLTFISLAAPLQLKGNHITLFWACETVLIYWLYQKSKMAIMQVSSMIIWVCMLLSLFIDWNKIYFDVDDAVTVTTMPVLLNKGFFASLFGAVATGLLHWLRRKDASDDTSAFSNMVPTSFAFAAVAVLLLYAGGALEINYQFTLEAIKDLYLPLYTYVFVIGLLLFLQKQNTAIAKPWIAPALMVVCFGIYLLQASLLFDIQQQLLEIGQPQKSHFIAHWIGALLVAWIISRFTRWVRLTPAAEEALFPAIVWAVCIFIITFLSIELHLVVNALLVQSPAMRQTVHVQFIKIGLPILWSLCSFAFMWLGMHFKHRTLRIISLALFAVTLLKLFLFDIRNISEGGKIAAFFCLGVILLVVSFMYQRLKKIIIAEEKPATND